MSEASLANSRIPVDDSSSPDFNRLFAEAEVEAAAYRATRAAGTTKELTTRQLVALRRRFYPSTAWRQAKVTGAACFRGAPARKRRVQRVRARRAKRVARRARVTSSSRTGPPSGDGDPAPAPAILSRLGGAQ